MNLSTIVNQLQMITQFSRSENGPIRMKKVDGFNFPPLPQIEETLESFPEFSAKLDDILFCGYPKAGNHWLMEMVSMLIRADTEILPTDVSNFTLEYRGEKGFRKINSQRMIQSHLLYNQLPLDIIKKRCKIIYTLRDPRDIAVSYYKFFGSRKMFMMKCNWDEFLSLYLKGEVPYQSWFDHVKSWEQLAERDDVSLLFVNYEDFHLKPVESLGRVAAFLGMDHDEAFLKAVTDTCKFDNMKKKKENLLPTLSYTNIFKYYRKGVVGDWKNCFTVAQALQFKEVYDREMAHSRFRDRYNGILE